MDTFNTDWSRIARREGNTTSGHTSSIIGRGKSIDEGSSESVLNLGVVLQNDSESE